MKLYIQTSGKQGNGKIASWVTVPITEEELKRILGNEYEENGYEIIGYVLPFEIQKTTSIDYINGKARTLLRHKKDWKKEMKRSFFQKETKKSMRLSS